MREREPSVYWTPTPAPTFKTQLQPSLFAAFHLRLPWFSVMPIPTWVLGPRHSGMTVLSPRSQSSVSLSPHTTERSLAFIVKIEDLSWSKVCLRMQWIFVERGKERQHSSVLWELKLTATLNSRVVTTQRLQMRKLWPMQVRAQHLVNWWQKENLDSALLNSHSMSLAQNLLCLWQPRLNLGRDRKVRDLGRWSFSSFGAEKAPSSLEEKQVTTFLLAWSIVRPKCYSLAPTPQCLHLLHSVTQQTFSTCSGPVR